MGMDQNEFNKLFEKAVEAYLKSGKSLPNSSMTQDEAEKKAPEAPKSSASSTQKASTEQAKKGHTPNETGPKVAYHGGRPNSKSSVPPSDVPHKEEKEEGDAYYVTVTQEQVGEMYILLRDICRNLLDVTQPWEDVNKFTRRTLDMIHRISPDDANRILNESLCKMRGSRCACASLQDLFHFLNQLC